MTEFESRCYGMSEDDMRTRYANYINAVGVEMFVAGILSDCQEMLESGGNENEIRRMLNKAKFFLFEKMERAA